jgi:hypothetical protein
MLTFLFSFCFLFLLQIACPAGFVTSSEGRASQCLKPAVSKILNQPLPPWLTVLQNQPNAVQIHWEYLPVEAFKNVVPDGFIVRLSHTRDFAETIAGGATFLGGTTTNGIIVVDEEVSLWVLRKSIYLQVNAYLSCAFKDKKCVTSDDKVNGKPAKSEWSTNTNSWTTAESCGDDEFLDTNHTDPSDWKCIDCPKGGACMGLTRWEDVRPLKGWWRVPWNNSVFKRCPFEADCIGYDINKHKRDQTEMKMDGCVVGTEGILCSQCSPGYNRDVAKCTKCAAESLTIRIGILIAVVLVILIIFVHFQRQLKKKWRKYHSLSRDLLRIFAITVTFSQINTAMPSIIEVPWPQNFVNFVAYFNVVNIDLFSLIGVSCVGNFNFYYGFLGMSSMPLAILLYASVGLCTAKRSMYTRMRHMNEKEQKLLLEESYHKLYHIADSNGGGTIDGEELCGTCNNSIAF